MATLTVYSAKWCSNCQPFKEALSKQGIEFKSIDADEEGATASMFGLGIRSLPASVVKDDEGNILLISTGSDIELIKKYL